MTDPEVPDVNKAFEALTAGLVAEQTLEASELLGSAIGAFHDSMRKRLVPRKIRNTIALGYAQYLFSSGMLEAIRAANAAAMEAMSSQEDDDD